LSQYTQKNLEFALTVDPKNEVLVKKMTWVQQQRKDKKGTVRSTIGDELEFNPFIKVDKESLQVTFICDPCCRLLKCLFTGTEDPGHGLDAV
jgi:hypothetical protein